MRPDHDTARHQPAGLRASVLAKSATHGIETKAAAKALLSLLRVRLTMPHDVVISIINYRTGDLTLNCVASVLADLREVPEIDAAIVVVDNASGDGSAEQIATWLESYAGEIPVDLIRSKTNSGFSGGHNQGLAARAAGHYLILNSDAVLRSGFFKAIMQTASQNPDAGLIAPRLEGDDGVTQNSHFRFHGVTSEMMRAASTGPLSRLFKHREIALGPDPRPQDVEWASFACILLNGAMVAEIGPMDEGYFLYYEDSEYCLRARHRGWPIVLCPEAVAVHFRGGSGPVKSLEKARKRLPPYYYRSRARFLCQAHGYGGLITANLFWHLGRGVANLRRFFGKPVPQTAAHEYRDIWIGVRNPLLAYRPEEPES